MALLGSVDCPFVARFIFEPALRTFMSCLATTVAFAFHLRERQIDCFSLFCFILSIRILILLPTIFVGGCSLVRIVELVCTKDTVRFCDRSRVLVVAKRLLSVQPSQNRSILCLIGILQIDVGEKLIKRLLLATFDLFGFVLEITLHLLNDLREDNRTSDMRLHYVASDAKSLGVVLKTFTFFLLCQKQSHHRIENDRHRISIFLIIERMLFNRNQELNRVVIDFRLKVGSCFDLVLHSFGGSLPK